MRTSSRPSACRAMPIFSVEVRIRVARKSPSQVSTASQRSSNGVRFQRSQLRQTTQRRPFAASKARRRPTGKASTTSLEPRGVLQNIQVVYTAVASDWIQRSSSGESSYSPIPFCNGNGSPRQRSAHIRRWEAAHPIPDAGGWHPSIWTPKRVPPRSAAPTGNRLGNPGGQRGAEHSPCQSATFNVAWAGLRTKRPSASPAGRPRKTSHRASPGTVSTGRRGKLRRVAVGRLALPRRRFRPYLYPSKIRDRASAAIPWPVDSPKSPSDRRKRALSLSWRGDGAEWPHQAPFPAPRPARYSAHCSIRTRRRSKRSERAYAASTLLRTACASAASMTACGASVHSAAQSRKLERNPCGTAGIPNSLKRALRGVGCSCTPLADGNTNSDRGAFAFASASTSRARTDPCGTEPHDCDEELEGRKPGTKTDRHLPVTPSGAPRAHLRPAIAHPASPLRKFRQTPSAVPTPWIVSDMGGGLCCFGAPTDR